MPVVAPLYKKSQNKNCGGDFFFGCGWFHPKVVINYKSCLPRPSGEDATAEAIKSIVSKVGNCQQHHHHHCYLNWKLSHMFARIFFLKPVFGRHRLSCRVQIVAPILRNPAFLTLCCTFLPVICIFGTFCNFSGTFCKKKILCHMSKLHVTCHRSHITCHMSPSPCH